MTVRIDHLSKNFSGKRICNAVKDINLELQSGSFLSIVGRSGSGKSTLLAMIGGISRPSSGCVLINDTDIWQLTENQRADVRSTSIGFVFQFASLLPTLRAIDNVALPALVSGLLSYKEAYARARSLLAQVGLGHNSDSYPGQLSGGEQRRVAIARALINAPSLLLADEPTADLDQETESEILNLLIDIHREFELTLVVVTHNPDIASRADQIMEMRQGEAVIKEIVAAAAPVGATAAHTQGHATRRAGSASRVSSQAARQAFEIPAAQLAAEHIQLGEGITSYIGRFVLWTIPAILIFWGLNFAVGLWQHNILQAQSEQRQALEDLAMSGLRAEVKDITLGPGRSYILSIYLRNTTGDKPLYVMSPTVRGFIQVGSSWQEVALKPNLTTPAQVQKITGTQIYQYTLEPDVQNFEQLLPYYMHVRFSNDMLISPRSQPKNDLIERSDNYYVYLKPHDVQDATILRKLKFPGKPPIWIPMPPH